MHQSRISDSVILARDKQFSSQAAVAGGCAATDAAGDGNQRLCRRIRSGTAYIAWTPGRTLQSRPDGVKLRPPLMFAVGAAGWILQMVSMTADLVGAAAAQTGSAAKPGEAVAQGHWSLLARLENSALGVRQADGSIRVRRGESAGCILYGPYLQLPSGMYRLNFRCDADRARMAAHPVLGVEVLVLSRFQQAWRDFTAAELQAGVASLIFEVPPEHSIDSEDVTRFEFRFFHFANAALAITAVELDRLTDEA